MDTNIIIGVLLVVLGVAIVFFMNQKSDGVDMPAGQEEKVEDEKKELSEEEKKALAEAHLAKRKEILKELRVPGSLNDVVFYFGSQTGTAEKFCVQLDEEAHHLGIPNSKVIDFNNFSEETFPTHKLAVIVVATHYEGDPCDNTKNFFKWLKKLKKDKKNPKPLAGMNFTVFGLGDTSYELFNEMGRVFDKEFEALGGNRLYKLGEGNAETFSTEDDFNNWTSDLWQTIFAHYEKSETAEEKVVSLQRRESMKMQRPVDPNTLPYTVVEPQALDFEPEFQMNGRNYVKSVDLPIKSIKELRQNPKDGLSTLEVVFDLRGTGQTYKTATNFACYPTNKLANVEAFAKKLNLDLDQKFSLIKNKAFQGRLPSYPFPIPAEGTTVKHVLTHFIDLTGAVTKKMLKDLANLANAEEKDKLLEVAKLGNKQMYEDLFISKNVGLIDLIDLYPSIREKLSLEQLIQKCTTIMPRYYTIASSSLAHPEEVAIAISMSVLNLPNGETRDGLTSGFLRDIFQNWTEDSKITVKSFIKDSNFVMPESSETPIVMVGPGTGVVPFIGFVQERQKMIENDKETKLGQADLYFGCREKNTDFIYRDFLADAEDKKLISNLNLAFSRPEEEGAKKQYVQHLLKENIEDVIKVLKEQQGYFYICGNTKMGNEVQTLLKESLGEEAFKQVQSDKRLLVELWSD